MPHKPHDDPAALLAELRGRVESATTEITQLTAELARRDGCIDELESALDTVLGLVEVPIMVVDVDHRIRALSRGAAERFGRDASVGKPLSSVVPEEVSAMVRARCQPSPPDHADADDPHRPLAAAGAGGGAVATVAPLPDEGAIVVVANGTHGRVGGDLAPDPAHGQSTSRRTHRNVPSDARREHGRRGRRSR